MENHLFIVSWGGESKIMSAASMEELWKRIRRYYHKGCVVTIEDAETKKVYVK